MALLSKFERGSSVYMCEICKNQTRDTGRGESPGVCARCYEEGGWQNEHFDFGPDHNGDGPSPDDCPECRGREWWE